MSKKVKIHTYIFKSELKKPIICAIVILLIISFLATISILSLRNKAIKNKKEYLIERAIFRATLVNERIGNNFDDLISISHAISTNGTLMHPSNFEILKFYQTLNDFRSLGVANLNGKAITTDNKVFNVKNNPLFKEILNGSKKSFSSSHLDLQGKTEISVLAVPIYKSFEKKSIQGVLFATIDKKMYNRILYLPSLNYKSINYIIEAPTGKIIYTNEDVLIGKFNLPPISQILEKYNIETIPQIKNDVDDNQSGLLYGRIDDKTFYMTYAPIGFNGWYLLNVTPEVPFSEEFSKLLTIIFCFSILLMIVIIALFHSYMRVYSKMYKAESLLRSVSATISKTFSLNEIKKVIVNEVGKTFKADACVIKDYDSFNDRFCSNRLSEYFKDSEKSLPEEYRCDNGKIPPNVMSKGYYIIEDVRKLIKTDEYKDDYYVNALSAAGLICGIRLPIPHNGIILGILSVSYKKPYKFCKEEIALLKAVLEQIAMAIRQASLYQRSVQSAKQEKLLKEILSISKLNLDTNEILQMVCKKIVSALDISGIKILNVIDYAKGDFKSYSYMQDEKIKPILNDTSRIDLLEYWMKATINFEVKIISDIENSDMPDSVQEYYTSYGLRSIACIPVRLATSRVYIFIGNHFREKYWTNQNIKTIKLLQEYMTILLKEKDLYNESKYLLNVSHELKTPITVINNYTELLIDDEKNSESSKKYLQKIKTNIDRMIELISDVLSISRLEDNITTSNINLRKYNLKTVIAKAIEQCSTSAKQKKVIIEFDPQPDVEFNMDSSLLQQVFVNLITNSIKYSDPDKIIKIGILPEEDTGKVKIKIKDEGYGIPESDIENIFERFYRVEKSRSRQTGGAGLGLAIVKKIVELHNGQIEVESILSVGTTFTLIFDI